MLLSGGNNLFLAPFSPGASLRSLTMSAEPRTREPRRKISRSGHLVHIYQPARGGTLYVPIIPAWGAAGLKRALDKFDAARRPHGPERRRDP
jgi:hypothetical protein